MGFTLTFGNAADRRTLEYWVIGGRFTSMVGLSITSPSLSSSSSATRMALVTELLTPAPIMTPLTVHPKTLARSSQNPEDFLASLQQLAMGPLTSNAPC